LYWRSGIAAETAAEHAKIVAALGNGDENAADAAMKEHIQASHDRLARFAETTG
jgi:DNA-binding FadR family transcriptional regulator